LSNLWQYLPKLQILDSSYNGVGLESLISIQRGSMKTWKFSWRLLVFTILMPIILSACTANPVDLSTAFTEIGLDEALIKFPNLKVEVYPYDASKPH